MSFKETTDFLFSHCWIYVSQTFPLDHRWQLITDFRTPFRDNQAAQCSSTAAFYQHSKINWTHISFKENDSGESQWNEWLRHQTLDLIKIICYVDLIPVKFIIRGVVNQQHAGNADLAYKEKKIIQSHLPLSTYSASAKKKILSAQVKTVPGSLWSSLFFTNMMFK